MRTDWNDSKIDDMLVDDEIVANKVKDNIQNSIKSSGCSIPECFDGNKPTKRGMEIIDDLNDQ